jgi:hypothetical protein
MITAEQSVQFTGNYLPCNIPQIEVWFFVICKLYGNLHCRELGPAMHSNGPLAQVGLPTPNASRRINAPHNANEVLTPRAMKVILKIQVSHSYTCNKLCPYCTDRVLSSCVSPFEPRRCASVTQTRPEVYHLRYHGLLKFQQPLISPTPQAAEVLFRIFFSPFLKHHPNIQGFSTSPDCSFVLRS